MGKIGFIFPGQGAQAVGMGMDIYKSCEASQLVFDKAEALLDFDLKGLCFEENQEINQTQYTQPALLTSSIALLVAIAERGIKPDMTAGLSLGEYSALVANGAMDFEDAVLLVRQRGIFMEEAAEETEGTMAAVVGSDQETVLGVLDSIEGYVTIANYNNPKQLVISGETKAINEAVSALSAQGIRAIMLTVSGAFHSKLMAKAADKLSEVLKDIDINEFSIPYYTNVTGQVVTDKDKVKDLLVEQVTGSVRWEENVRAMIEAGVDLFIEIGPGKTLAGLIKKIDRKVKVIGVSDSESLEALVSYMEDRA